VNLVDN
jgi:hypothetical protein